MTRYVIRNNKKIPTAITRNGILFTLCGFYNRGLNNEQAQSKMFTSGTKERSEKCLNYNMSVNLSDFIFCADCYSSHGTWGNTYNTIRPQDSNYPIQARCFDLIGAL